MLEIIFSSRDAESYLTKSIYFKDRICIKRQREAQILGVDSGYNIIYSRNQKIIDSSFLNDVIADGEENFWVAVKDCSIVRI